MEDAKTLLDQQLRSLNRAVLTHGGQIKMTDAKLRAERQYEIYSANRKIDRQKEADREIAELRRTDKALPRTTRSKS